MYTGKKAKKLRTGEPQGACAEEVRASHIEQKEKKKKEGNRNSNASLAAKVALGILGVGFVAGTTLVLGIDRVMKKIFVNEDWPDEDWSSDDWAEEDLEG